MKKNAKSIIFYLLLFAVIVGVVSTLYQGPVTEELLYSDLIQEIQAGNIKSLEITENLALATRADNTKFQTAIPSIQVLHNDIGDTIKKQIETGVLDYSTPKPTEAPWWLSLLPGIILVVMFFLFWIFF